MFPSRFCGMRGGRHGIPDYDGISWDRVWAWGRVGESRGSRGVPD